MAGAAGALTGALGTDLGRGQALFLPYTMIGFATVALPLLLSTRVEVAEAGAASTATPASAAKSGSGRCPRRSGWRSWSMPQAAGLARRPEQAVFPGRWRHQPVDGKYIGEQLRQAAELAGIPLERPLHTLRHSYARALRRVEAPLEAVQAALDHSNLATTSIYLLQLEGQEDPWWPKLASELGLQGGGESSRVDKGYGDLGHLDQEDPAR